MRRILVTSINHKIGAANSEPGIKSPYVGMNTVIAYTNFLGGKTSNARENFVLRAYASNLNSKIHSSNIEDNYSNNMDDTIILLISQYRSYTNKKHITVYQTYKTV